MKQCQKLILQGHTKSQALFQFGGLHLVLAPHKRKEKTLYIGDGYVSRPFTKAHEAIRAIAHVISGNSLTLINPSSRKKQQQASKKSSLPTWYHNYHTSEASIFASRSKKALAHREQHCLKLHQRAAVAFRLTLVCLVSCRDDSQAAYDR
ncbi:polycystic kidney disease 1 like 1 [Anopheles sinensis]|uniref:Polycystic kidney disease 1 like 1 n=1 Tax=Anopheles sinensis TaxID=74873 RepID=A0A084WBK2_ANOSI|nr:polycystic kidney disease 1 like 1 [Anopheles sinensis]